MPPTRPSQNETTTRSESGLVYTFVDGPFLETEGVPMGNRRYTRELMIRFLDIFEKRESVAKAARALGVLNDEVCYSWVRKRMSWEQDTSCRSNLVNYRHR